MKALIAAIRRFGQDQRGLTAIEYGLMAATIALAVTAGATKVSDGLNTVFTAVKTALTS
ncbi:Flp family type IVb pilin [Pseudoduganella sp. RAF53_2]|uniref:Flp family type IVb pilin n=1 Tax=unclassified Pseudoduganella TaxID=2637179 RepID=UPI003F943CDF